MSTAMRLPTKARGILKGPRPDWAAQLVRNDKNVPRPLLSNCLVALRAAPEWKGVLGFNQFKIQAEALRETPFGLSGPWTDLADLLTCEWLQKNEIYVSVEVAAQAVQAHAQANPFHPVRDWLSTLTWDSERRIHSWLSSFLGAKESDYTSAVGKRWLISAIARIFKPGSKADCALILEGPQGLGKSQALSILGGPWFTDEIAELGSKDASMQLQGAWLIEMAELHSLTKSEVSRIKAFMSRTSDRFRPPYGRRLIEAPRQCVFAGTVNHSDYLRDETGNRRFWPVECTSIDLKRLSDVRDQLWAEAKAEYDAGTVWWLDTRDLIGLANDQQAERYEGDAWDTVIARWAEPRGDVSISEVLGQCLNKDPALWTQADRNRVSRCLKAAGGWRRYNARTGTTETGREWRYRREE